MKNMTSQNSNTNLRVSMKPFEVIEHIFQGWNQKEIKLNHIYFPPRQLRPPFSIAASASSLFGNIY